MSYPTKMITFAYYFFCFQVVTVPKAKELVKKIGVRFFLDKNFKKIIFHISHLLTSNLVKNELLS